MVKKYLNNKDGMALPTVLILMLILTILAAGLGTYASQSFRSVKYMNAQKQAYYLSRAGVEAGAFAYQNATTKKSSYYDNADNFANGLANFSDVDKFLAVIENSDEKITSNKVYLVYDERAANEGSMWDGLSFQTYEGQTVTKATHPNVIGYFSIEIAGGQQDTIVEDSETPVLKDVVEFRSTAVCFNDEGHEVKRVSSGYMYPSRSVDSQTCYDANGYLSTDASMFDNTDSKTVNYSEETFNTQTGSWWNRLKNGLVKLAFKALQNAGLIPSSEQITVYELIGGGDLILARPSKDVGEIKINDNINNFYIFSTSGTVILEDCGLYVDPTKGKYATIGLYGSDIVIDGDITMGVYHTNTSAYAGSTLGTILEPLTTFIDTIGNRYRLGTVMIGCGIKSGGNWPEYLTVTNGGVTDKNGTKLAKANRVFFNGNVNVKIYSQGSSTETYRVFSAGDICLFNGLYEVTNTNNGKEVDTRGIDLLKYFLDAVIAGEKGFEYGSAAVKKMKGIRELYYGDANDPTAGEPSYFTVDAGGNIKARPIRKINADFSSTNVKIDGYDIIGKAPGTDIDIIEYIQQPTPTSGFNINWGKPTVSVLAN